MAAAGSPYSRLSAGAAWMADEALAFGGDAVGKGPQPVSAEHDAGKGQSRYRERRQCNPDSHLPTS